MNYNRINTAFYGLFVFFFRSLLFIALLETVGKTLTVFLCSMTSALFQLSVILYKENVEPVKIVTPQTWTHVMKGILFLITSPVIIGSHIVYFSFKVSKKIISN